MVAPAGLLERFAVNGVIPLGARFRFLAALRRGLAVVGKVDVPAQERLQPLVPAGVLAHPVPSCGDYVVHGTGLVGRPRPPHPVEVMDAEPCGAIQERSSFAFQPGAQNPQRPFRAGGKPPRGLGRYACCRVHRSAGFGMCSRRAYGGLGIRASGNTQGAVAGIILVKTCLIVGHLSPFRPQMDGGRQLSLSGVYSAPRAISCGPIR
jgi:hypothetical protein